jgi:hypothetical protein
MGVLDDILPPDRSDAAPITTHLRGLLEQLHNGQGERPRITIALEADAWAMLERQFRRPYRPHSSYMYIPIPDAGVVAFERKRESIAIPASETQNDDLSGPPLPLPELFPFRRGDTQPANFLGERPSDREAESPPKAVRPWTTIDLEAKAAALTVPTDSRRPEDAIYTAPLAGPISEAGAPVVDVATYGGPWKGDGK